MKAAVSHDSTFGKFLCAAVLLHTGIFSQERMIMVMIADSCTPPPFHGLTQSKSVLGF
jgi:hypothetical protein